MDLDDGAREPTREDLSWVALLFELTKPTRLLSCPECSALVPTWPDARLNHERWHAQRDGRIAGGSMES